jgi:hypothetical protein
MTGSNRRLPPCKGEGDESETVIVQGFVTPGFPACTNACTSKPESGNAGAPDDHQNDARDNHQANKSEGVAAADPLAVLAAALAMLSPADRGRLAGLLTGG